MGKKRGKREKICGIYKIENIINGKVYIGQSVDVYKRWHEHFKYLRQNQHINRHLQSAYNLYGESNFVASILERCDRCNLNNREQFWILHYNSMKRGYNLTAGGEGNLEWKPSSNVGKRRKVVCLNNGIQYASIKSAAHHSHGCEQSIGLCCRGAIKSSGKINGQNLVWRYYDDYKSMNPNDIEKLISIANSKRNTNCRKVVCLNTGITYKSLREASDAYGISVSNIQGCCVHRNSYAGIDDVGNPLIWAYDEDYRQLSPMDIKRICNNTMHHRQSISSALSVPVICLNDHKRFDSLGQAAIYYNVLSSSISACCAQQLASVLSNGVPLVFIYEKEYACLSQDEMLKKLIKAKCGHYKLVRCKETGQLFIGTESAAKYVGLGKQSIICCCNGKAKTGGKHPVTKQKLSWEYVNIDTAPMEDLLQVS